MVESEEFEVSLGTAEDDEFIDEILKNIASTKVQAQIIEDDENTAQMMITPPLPEDTSSVVSDISPESLSE